MEAVGALGAERAQRARLVGQIVGRGFTIDADADHRRHSIMRGVAPGGDRHAFEQDAAELGAVEQDVVRPFQRETLAGVGRRAQGVEAGEPGDEAELRRDCVAAPKSERIRLA